jgi:hypothetical protein
MQILLCQGLGGEVMKIELTENQLDAIYEALDFWQGSLIGIEDYATEYRRAVRTEEMLRDKARKAKV